MTNQEKIKRMTREELAKLLCELSDCGGCPYMEDCSTDHNGAYVWLGEEAENEN